MERRRGRPPGYSYRAFRTEDPPKGVPIRARVAVTWPDGSRHEHFAPGLFVHDRQSGRIIPMNDAALAWAEVTDDPEFLGWALPRTPRMQKPKASGAPPKAGG